MFAAVAMDRQDKTSCSMIDDAWLGYRARVGGSGDVGEEARLAGRRRKLPVGNVGGADAYISHELAFSARNRYLRHT